MTCLIVSNDIKYITVETKQCKTTIVLEAGVSKLELVGCVMEISHWFLPHSMIKTIQRQLLEEGHYISLLALKDKHEVMKINRIPERGCMQNVASERGIRDCALSVPRAFGRRDLLTFFKGVLLVYKKGKNKISVQKYGTVFLPPNILLDMFSPLL